MIRNRFLGKLALVLVAVLFVNGTMLGITKGLVSASEELKIGNLTSAPPVQSMSTFDPNHQYLFNGTNSITALTGTVSIGADTSATQVVDSIGIIFYVQKWNGSSWETVGSGSTTGGNNSGYYTNSISRSSTAGYYYRARTIHWVIENGVYEEGERFSSAVLAK